MTFAVNTKYQVAEASQQAREAAFGSGRAALSSYLTGTATAPQPATRTYVPVSVHKVGCAEAQGAVGYVCDFSTGDTSRGRLRFYQDNGVWVAVDVF